MTGIAEKQSCADVSARRVLVVVAIVLAPPAVIFYGWGLEQLIRALGGS